MQFDFDDEIGRHLSGDALDEYEEVDEGFFIDDELGARFSAKAGGRARVSGRRRRKPKKRKPKKRTAPPGYYYDSKGTMWKKQPSSTKTMRSPSSGKAAKLRAYAAAVKANKGRNAKLRAYAAAVKANKGKAAALVAYAAALKKAKAKAKTAGGVPVRVMGSEVVRPSILRGAPGPCVATPGCSEPHLLRVALKGIEGRLRKAAVQRTATSEHNAIVHRKKYRRVVLRRLHEIEGKIDQCPDPEKRRVYKQRLQLIVGRGAA